ncbi:MAG TPA: cupredoxin domain-containing protein [Stellaceae bacterium]|nr:cupredoxin domain-containing protein [Stellaceae bacterium]
MSGGGEPLPAPLARATARLGRRAVLAGLLTSLAARSRADSTAPATIELGMTEYRFIPDHLTLQQGVRYRLVLDNRGAEVHEFTAPQLIAASTVENPDILDASGKAVVVKPGERRELRFIAPAAGLYPFICADHDWAGMTGEITVR